MVSATEYQRAVEAFAQEYYEEAGRLFTSLIENRPEDPNLRLWLASAQQQIGRPDLARQQYEEVLGLTTDTEILKTAQSALQHIKLDNPGLFVPAVDNASFALGFTDYKPFDQSQLEDIPNHPFNSTPTASGGRNDSAEQMISDMFAFEPSHDESDFLYPPLAESVAAPDAMPDREPKDNPLLPKPSIAALTEAPTGGWLADRSLAFKQALALGALTLSTVAAVNFAVYYTVETSGLDATQRSLLMDNALIGGLIGAGLVGVSAFVVYWTLIRAVVKPLQQLQKTARLVAEGDLLVRFTPGSRDEIGQLAATFNKMAIDLQRGIAFAQEEMSRQQQDKELLQEEIIRLLDEVEGASQGNLTVKAEVNASLTGAVADAFNVTISSLRDIIAQVKQAVQKVNLAALNSENFARGLSNDALHQAEEIFTSLTAIQQMTLSIQQVAQNARRTENVARQASMSAERGGQAVDRTVESILGLRETVSETGKKVKRLAESTQEISKIVGFIHQLSSRTNLLALNASIEAVRAGEAGRGFAVVADEVRQLADRAAKATREIEQIVLNIQSETGAVMQAIEKGTQQVVAGTQLAEQARQSLDEIIEVSVQIDTLIVEISLAASEQEQTSCMVAGVMENVANSAQNTSIESLQVSDALQGLVRVAGDLRASTDRFQV